MTHSALGWRELESLPFYKCTNPAVISNSKYTVASGEDDHNFAEYNVSDNTWISFRAQSNGLTQGEGNTVSFNQKYNKLYIIGDEDNCALVLDYDTKNLDVLYEYSRIHSHLIVATADDLHILGNERGRVPLCHQVVDAQSVEDEDIGGFEVVCNKISVWNGGAAVHCKKRNSIIVYGRKMSSFSDFEGSGLIFCEYMLAHKKWNVWKWPKCKREWIGDGSAGMVCTADGRYLITFGGFIIHDQLDDIQEETDRIIVYDLENRNATPLVSQIRCPIKSGFHGTMMTDKHLDELLTFGFIRKCFKSRNMKSVQLLPRYLIEMIGKWFETKWIHLLQREGEGHWKMRIHDILKSVRKK